MPLIYYIAYVIDKETPWNFCSPPQEILKRLSLSFQKSLLHYITSPFCNLHVFEGGIHSWVSISLWPLRQRRTVAGASASRRSDDQRAGGAIVSSARAMSKVS